MSYINEALQKAHKERIGKISSYELIVAKSAAPQMPGHKTLTYLWKASIFCLILFSVAAMMIYQRDEGAEAHVTYNDSEKINVLSKKDRITSQIKPEDDLATQPIHSKRERNHSQQSQYNTDTDNEHQDNHIKYQTNELKDQLITKKGFHSNKEKKDMSFKEDKESSIPSEPESFVDKKYISLSVPLDLNQSEKTSSLDGEKQPQKNHSNVTLPTDIFLLSTELYHKGLTHQMNNKYEEAIQCYLQCIELSPDMAPAYNNMGVIELNNKRLDSAKAYFEQAIHKRPAYVDPYYNMACLFSQRQQIPQALYYLRRAISLSEDARYWAMSDSDFQPLYELTEFNSIISGNSK